MNPLVKIGLIAGLSAMVGFLLDMEGLKPEQVKVAAIMVFAISAWTTEVIPAPVVSLAAISLLVILKVVDFETATSGFTAGVIWLLLGVSMLGYALEKVGLVDRMAGVVVHLGKGSVPWTLLVMIGAILIVTILVPTAIARTGLISVLSNGVIRAVGEQHAKAVSLAATMSIFALQLTVITGTGGALYLVAYLESNGTIVLNYLTWLTLMMPPGICMGLTVWLLIVKRHKLKGVKISLLPDKQLDPVHLTLDQWRVIIISVLTLFVWIAGPSLDLDIYAYTLLLMVIMLLPGVGGVAWNEVKDAIPWGAFLLFGGALALGVAVKETGIASYMASHIMNFVRGDPTWLVVIGILVFFLISRIIFVNLISLMVTIVPIVLVVGTEIGWNPVWMILLGLITGSAGYLVPAQSPVALLMLGNGHFSETDLRSIGIFFTLIWSLLVVLAAFTYWPMLGLNPRL